MSYRVILTAIAIVSLPASNSFANMSRAERVSQLLATTRVLHDRCKISGNPEILFQKVREAGFDSVDFVPTGKYWRYTRKAMDQRFGLIADVGLGSACNSMNEVVQGAVPGY